MRPAGAPFGPTVSFDGLSSRYAMLIDADSGEVIQSRDADARMYPASLTKVMTAVVVLDHAETLDGVVEAPADMSRRCGSRTPRWRACSPGGERHRGGYAVRADAALRGGLRHRAGTVCGRRRRGVSSS